jgi:hypothetical protein
MCCALRCSGFTILAKFRNEKVAQLVWLSNMGLLSGHGLMQGLAWVLWVICDLREALTQSISLSTTSPSLLMEIYSSYLKNIFFMVLTV